MDERNTSAAEALGELAAILFDDLVDARGRVTLEVGYDGFSFAVEREVEDA